MINLKRGESKRKQGNLETKIQSLKVQVKVQTVSTEGIHAVTVAHCSSGLTFIGQKDLTSPHQAVCPNNRVGGDN